MIETLIAIAVGLTIIAFLAGLVLFIVGILKHGLKLDMHTLLKAYLYFMSFITLIIAVFGASLFLKAGFSQVFGYDFSYRVDTYYGTPAVDLKTDVAYPSPYEGREMIEIRGEKYYVDKTLPRKDMINGSILFISLFALFLIHRVAIHYIEPKSEGFTVFKKFYTFTSLTIYSLLGIIALPIAIYDLINYLLWNDSMNNSYYGSYSMPIPGESLSALILVLPIWIIFLAQVIRYSRKERKALAV
jgi:uncharacterized membrane protein YozB (DUF420 family)